MLFPDTRFVMPFCTACGAKNPDEARFCNACGAAMPTVSPVAPVLASVTVSPLKPFDNPNELWKMFFYVSVFNLGMYFFTSAADDILGYGIAAVAGISAIFYGIVYWILKVQAVDKNRSLWLLPLIAFQVYAYLDGLSGLDDLTNPNTFDVYDTYLSGLPELFIVIKLFLALRERASQKT
jgi:zinc-ribbon domain